MGKLVPFAVMLCFHDTCKLNRNALGADHEKDLKKEVGSPLGIREKVRAYQMIIAAAPAPHT
jgi:hypothetical protein